MSSLTTNFNFILPAVNSAVDQDLWGGELNDNFTSLDSLLETATNNLKRVVTGTDSATIADRNKILLGDATSASYVQTLPSAATVANGFTIYFTKTDATANTISVTRAGSDTIGGSASAYVLSAQNDFLTIISDGVSNWNYQSRATMVPDASTSVKGIVALATAAETLAGTDAVKALTAAGMAGNKSLSTNGYYKFPGGLILQWGTQSIATGNTVSVSLPVSFPNNFFAPFVSKNASTGGNISTAAPKAYVVSLSQIGLTNNDGGGPNPVDYTWVAIGN